MRRLVGAASKACGTPRAKLLSSVPFRIPTATATSSPAAVRALFSKAGEQPCALQSGSSFFSSGR